MNSLNLLLGLVVSFFPAAIASSSTIKESKPVDSWQAQWICPDKSSTEDRRNSWFCYRKALEVNNIPNTFSVKIACDSKYWLWINGNLVILEGGLKRGPTPTGTYFDVVDFAPSLKKGTNEIAIMMWHFGKHGFSHNDSGKVGLIVDGASGNLILKSDSSWRVRRHSAFEDADDPGPNYRLPEGNIRYDARKALAGWQTDYPGKGWSDAIESGLAGVDPWGELIERPILQWKDFGLKEYEQIVETTENHVHERDLLRNPERIGDAAKVKLESLAKGKRNVLVGELPHNGHVHPYLSITAKAGLKIDIQTDLLTNYRDMFLRAEYITKEGDQEFELPGWLNGHEVRYFIPEGVKVNSIKYRETGYNAEFSGTFECDDPRLNTLWEKARRTLYVTMRDTYMDCPERERAQWWGDAVNEIGEAFYVFDAANGPKLAKKGILELIAYQREDKTIYSPVPAGVPPNDERENLGDGTWNRELPRQMLASVGYYGFWTYYLYTGDVKTIRTVYPGVRDYLSVWQLDHRGLAVHRTGEWDWTDWGNNMDVAVLESAWLHLALRGAKEMALLLGEKKDARVFQERMERIESGFNKTFWQGSYYRSPSHDGETDDRANALAVVAGLSRLEYYPAITKFLGTNMHASPYMEKYVLEALFIMQKPNEGIKRIFDRYIPMIDAKVTTLWENFARPGSDEPGSGTYNHAWSGGPLTMMHQYIAGIEPIESGFKRFSVKPQLGSLKWVKTIVPTPYGDIQLQVHKVNSNSMEVMLTVPEGTSADVFTGEKAKSYRSGQHTWRVDSAK